MPESQNLKTIELPAPALSSDTSVEAAMFHRRSVRSFSDDSVTSAVLSQLLWSCQGITSIDNRRTTPSAGALYPLEIYAAVERVDDLEPGVYHYLHTAFQQPQRIQLTIAGSFADRFADIALGQDCIREAAVNIVICSVISRTSLKYGERAERYVYLEIGHAAQNVCLQAQSLNLGAVPVGAFSDSKMKSLLNCNDDPIYIMCIGMKRL